MDKKELFPLSALLGRMKYIDRWSLMHNSRKESLSEHTTDTALLAHILCLIGREYVGTGEELRPEVVATAALYHDASEILTGDMPTPVKYKNETLRAAYKNLEYESASAMADLLPDRLQEKMKGYLTGDALREREKKILKAADRLSAIIKCIEEEKGGNSEFSTAGKQQLAALHEMDLPEAEYFVEHMLPCFSQNLDELTRGRI